MEASDLVFVILATVGCSAQLFDLRDPSPPDTATPLLPASTAADPGAASLSMFKWLADEGGRLARSAWLVMPPGAHRNGSRTRRDEDPVP